MLNELPIVCLFGGTSFLLRGPIGMSVHITPDLESLALARGASENEFLFKTSEFVDFLIGIHLALNARQKVRTATIFCWIANINRERLWIGQGFNERHAGGKFRARFWQTGACDCCVTPHHYCNRHCGKNQATKIVGPRSWNKVLGGGASPVFQNTIGAVVSGRLDGLLGWYQHALTLQRHHLQRDQFALHDPQRLLWIDPAIQPAQDADQVFGV